MAADRILEGLNEAQRTAVSHDAGPLLIVAGAGTGKTTVITRRIAYLIAQRRARPDEILALTFTDKAAAEMEERVDTLVPYGYADVENSTFQDFGDQIVQVLRLLRARPYVLGAYQRRFKYVLVDEFQDTNYAQFELVKLLAARHANVAVVGDEDQAIYRFRGAAISNILGFLTVYPEARQIVLTENYRSTQEILDAAYRLIQYNNPDPLEVRSGISKQLQAVAEAGQPPVNLCYETATQEADAVAKMIRDKVAEGAWKYDDVAILVRSNSDADQFLRSLNLRGIPWTFSGNAGLYGRPEIRLLISFLRSVAHVDESVSLHYLASSDLYQVPIVDLTRCATHAQRRHVSLFDVFRRAGEIAELRDEIAEDGHAAIRRLVADLTRYMELGRDRQTGEVLYQFLVDSGWLTRMSKAATARDEAEVQNIRKFFDRVRDASRALRYDNVGEFVKHLDALIEAGEDPAVAEADVETPAVRVLTVHKAKGLEFPVVFLVNLVQDKFPSRRRRDALELPLALIKDVLPAGDYHQQEERRLFYVGMTRARPQLYLTSARDYGGSRERT